LAQAMHQSREQMQPALASFRQAQHNFEERRRQGLRIIEQMHNGQTFDDTNYIFLSFVRSYLPVGLVGLVIGVIFSASMGSTSGEINSLATVSVVDIYRRYFVRNRDDRHYLIASRFLTVFWGANAIAFAAVGARGFGALIVRVNIVGSWFYGGMLGVFVLAFFCKNVGGTAAFRAVLAGQAAIFAVALLTNISFLWYNVIGCLVVVGVGLALSPRRSCEGLSIKVDP
jgi:Na+/proline symporter